MSFKKTTYCFLIYRNSLKIISLILILLFTLSTRLAFACPIAINGTHWGMNKLVEQADTILIAKAIKVQTIKSISNKLSQPTKTTFQIIEKLRGNPQKEIAYTSYFDQYSNNDFKDHTEAEFWKYGIGRKAADTSCGPWHSFVEGEIYLLFPNHFNAYKSAEVLKSDDDKWLHYVKERL